MIELAYAKLNLILDIVGKRADGYHELKSLMIPLEFADELTFEPSTQVELKSNFHIDHNVIIKTANWMKDHYGVKQGVVITLTKRIPVGAGLAGGSANISATIRGLNRFWNLNLTLEAQEDIANLLGSDTLFCLHNTRAMITGRGDYIQKLKVERPIENITLVCPSMSLLTKTVFSFVQETRPHDFYHHAQAFLETSEEHWLYNDLLIPAFKASPALEAIYQKIKDMGLNPHLSGSGSTLFLLNLTENQKQQLQEIKGITIIDTKEHHKLL